MGTSLFDAHCDTITTAMDQKKNMRQNDLHVSFKNGIRFEKYAQVFAIWTDDKQSGQDGFDRFIEAYKYFICQMNDYGHMVRFCTTRADYQAALQGHKIAAFLSMENAVPIIQKDCNVDFFLDLGVKILSFTWNGDNILAGGCMGDGGGLTLLGKTVLTRLSGKKVIIDVSHLSERGFYDIAQNDDVLICASHSNLKSVFDHKRNLTDEQFKEIIRHGGGVGLNLYPAFLGGDKMADIIRQIEGFLALGGEDSVFLGCDFDGIDQTPLQISGLKDMYILSEELLKLNYSEVFINKLFYDNLERTMLKVL